LIVFISSRLVWTVLNIQTPFGDLRLEQTEDFDHGALKAELRSLDLLHYIAQTSRVWKFTQEENGSKICLITDDFPPQVHLDPLETIKRKFERRDTNLRVTYEGKLRCVLLNRRYKSALGDGLVSLLLLGEAGWPIDETPNTLIGKAWMMRDEEQ
jgi:hypothetical protein